MTRRIDAVRDPANFYAHIKDMEEQLWQTPSLGRQVTPFEASSFQTPGERGGVRDRSARHRDSG